MTPPPPAPPPGNRLQRLLATNVPVLGLIAAIAGIAIAGHYALSTRIDGINTRLDETNARIDQTNTRLDETNARIDETNTRIDSMQNAMNARFDTLQNTMNARFDHLSTLIEGVVQQQGVVQEHSRRLDSLERHIANTPIPPSTP